MTFPNRPISIIDIARRINIEKLFMENNMPLNKFYISNPERYITEAGATQLTGHRIPVLDGVRAISIVAVLFAHLLPVHIAGISYNTSVGIFGMSLFFILSGFLVTTQGLQMVPPAIFAKRRLLRVVPAAWLCIMLVTVFSSSVDGKDAIGYLLFVANIPPQQLPKPLDHFWSLCVEIQFYFLVYVFLLCKSTKIWFLLPLMLIFSTLTRVYLHIDGTSITWFRMDDILAGATLAIWMHGRSKVAKASSESVDILFIICLLLFMAGSLHEPHLGENYLNYARPYAAAMVVCILMIRPNGTLEKWLAHPALRYIAGISYALYIWHQPLVATWLGSGDTVEKYAKRPLLFAALWLIAHLSTRYFENYFASIGHPTKQAGLPLTNHQS